MVKTKEQLRSGVLGVSASDLHSRTQQHSPGIKDGTLARHHSPKPGVCKGEDQGILRQYGYVTVAWTIAENKYLLSEAVRVVGANLEEAIEGFVPAMMDAAKIWISTVGFFTLVGAIVGFLFGGVGAAPGAAVGTKVGVVVASALLALMGIYFLFEHLKDRLSDVGDHISAGVRQAWTSCGNRESIERAAKEIATGEAILVGLIIDALVVYVARRGFKSAKNQLQGSKSGKSLATALEHSYVQLRVLGESWLNKLGLQKKPALWQLNAGIAVSYFERFNFPEPMIRSFLKAMDLSQQNFASKLFGKHGVRSVVLRAGDEVVAYRDVLYHAPTKTILDVRYNKITKTVETRSAADGFFYTKPGTNPTSLGISNGPSPYNVNSLKTIKQDVQAFDKFTAAVKKINPNVDIHDLTVERVFTRYQVKRNVDVLESRTTGVRDFWTAADEFPKGVDAPGGGIQYIFPGKQQGGTFRSSASEYIDVIHQKAPQTLPPIK